MADPSIFSLIEGSADPIYLQIVAQVRRRVAGGQLQPGDELPSVRDLAKTLHVNPRTVSKAFGVLEVERLVIRRRGMQMVIASRHATGDAAVLGEKLLRPTLANAAREAVQLRLRSTQAVDLFTQILREGRLNGGKCWHRGSSVWVW